VRPRFDRISKASHIKIIFQMKKVLPIWEAFHAGLVDPNGTEKITRVAGIGFCCNISPSLGFFSLVKD